MTVSFTSETNPEGREVASPTVWMNGHECTVEQALKLADTIRRMVTRAEGVSGVVNPYPGLDLADTDHVIGHVSVYRILDREGDMRVVLVTDDGDGRRELDSHTTAGMLAIAQHMAVCDLPHD